MLGEGFSRGVAQFLAAIMIVFLLAGAGIAAYKHFTPAPPQPPVKPGTNLTTEGHVVAPGSNPQIVYIQGKDTHTKEIVYQEKALDPLTGQREKTDVEFVTRDRKVYVKVNGKEFEIVPEVKEGSKFEKGKVVITEETTMAINLTTPKKVAEAGVGWGTQGPAVMVGVPINQGAGVWVVGTKGFVAGGLTFPINRDQKPKEEKK